MNKLLRKLENKIGRYSVPNLMRVFVVCNVIGLILNTWNPYYLNYLTLDPGLILKGEFWRILTWLFIPASLYSLRGIGLLFSVVFLLFYYSVGRALEIVWGRFYFNYYIFSGFFLTIIGAFIAYFGAGMNEMERAISVGYFDTGYLLLSLFFAYAMTFPNAIFRLYFLIPVPAKVLGIIDLILFGIDLVRSIAGLALGARFFAGILATMLAAILNYVLFYLSYVQYSRFSPAEIRRRRQFRKAMQSQREEFQKNMASTAARPAAVRPSRHRCVICGKTELTDPDMEFRFCSKCEDGYEYCMEHLHSHTHVISNKKAESGEERNEND